MQKTSNKFNTIKQKHVIGAVVKSAVCGLSLGLFAVGVLMLSLKLSAIMLAAWCYVLVGIGAAAVGGVAFFLLLFNPSDKEVAKRTDNDYELNERVQTSLEYADQSGTNPNNAIIFPLQRARNGGKITSKLEGVCA